MPGPESPQPPARRTRWTGFPDGVDEAIRKAREDLEAGRTSPVRPADVPMIRDGNVNGVRSRSFRKMDGCWRVVFATDGTVLDCFKVGARGGPAVEPSDGDKADYVALVESGSGPWAAAKEMGYEFRTLKRAMDADPQFKDAVRAATAVPEDACSRVLHSVATDPDGDPRDTVSAAAQFLKYRAAARAARATAKRFAADLALRTAEAEARLRASGVTAGEKAADFQKMTPPEFRRYDELYARGYQAGGILTDDEKREFGELSLKLCFGKKDEDE